MSINHESRSNTHKERYGDSLGTKKSRTEESLRSLNILQILLLSSVTQNKYNDRHLSWLIKKISYLKVKTNIVINFQIIISVLFKVYI